MLGVVFDTLHLMPLPSPLIPTKPISFGRYLLLQRLATGGMAEVYRAKLLGVAGFEKSVAIKRILSFWTHNQDFISMLIDEAKIAVQLNHPNIVQVYELGKEGEDYYIAMEYIEGFDLRRLLKSLGNKVIPRSLVFYIIGEMAKGLHYAHTKTSAQNSPLKVVHRDISPQNILISLDGEIKITDFGIAKAATRSHETLPGTFKGKFAYMSPEQASQKELDYRSDLFSMGILFFEMLTHSRLFGATNDVAVLEKVRQASVVFPEKPPLLPQALKALLLKLLEKDPEKRLHSAQAFLHDLNQYRVSQDHETMGTSEGLSRFLKDNLPQEVETLREESTRLVTQTLAYDKGMTVTRTEETRHSEEKTEGGGTQILVTTFEKMKDSSWGYLKRSPFWKASWAPLLGVALVFLLYGGYHFFQSKGSMSPREEKLPITSPVAPVVDKTPPESPPPPIEIRQIVPGDPPSLIPQKSESATSLSPGSLSVQAIPWGVIYIDQGKKGWETPMKPVELPAGPHQIRVYYKPDRKWLTKNIDISPGQKMHCIVQFGSQKTALECTP